MVQVQGSSVRSLSVGADSEARPAADRRVQRRRLARSRAGILLILRTSGFAKIDVDFAELRRPKVSIFLGARQNARACSRCFGDQLTVGGGLQSIWMTKEDVATSSVERGRRRRVLANRLVFGRETRIPPTSRWSPRNAGPHGVERVPALRARSPGHAKLSGRPDGALRAPESRWCDELCTQCPAESPLSGRPTRR